jgi:hypothetical protein
MGVKMKKFLMLVLLLLIIFGVLAAKIYLDLIGRPRYYLDQIGVAITAHNLEEFERLVAVSSISRGIVADYFQGFSARPARSSDNAALQNELVQAVAQQIREYVRTGRVKNGVSLNLSKPARTILARLSLTEAEVNQFYGLAYVKEAEGMALVGLNSLGDTGNPLTLEFKMRQDDTGWRVVGVNNFWEVKSRLYRRAQQKNIKIEDLLVQGVKNSVLWGKYNREEVFLELHNSKAPDWPTGLAISVDGQGRLVLTLVRNSFKTPLRVNLDKAEAIEEDGRLNSHYRVQAGEYDFDGDSQAELVVAIGDNSIDLVVNIFKYYPETKGEAAADMRGNWVLAGVFMGQNKAYVNGRNIRLPYTAVDLEKEYRWGKKGFEEVR